MSARVTMKERSKSVTVSEAAFNALTFIRDQHAERGGGKLSLGAMLGLLVNKALGIEPRMLAGPTVRSQVKQRGGEKRSRDVQRKPQVQKTKRTTGRRSKRAGGSRRRVKR